MEFHKQICQSCVESTYYTSVRPRFCMACGQSFAVFADKTNSIAKAAVQMSSEQVEDDNENAEDTYSPKIRPASFYRNKVKKPFEDSDDGDDDKGELEEDGDDFQGGDPDFRGSGNQTNILDFLSNGPKKSAGVKFTDIIKPEPSPSNDSAKSVKSKTAKAPSSKATGAKRGRPSKKT